MPLRPEVVAEEALWAMANPRSYLRVARIRASQATAMETIVTWVAAVRAANVTGAALMVEMTPGPSIGAIAREVVAAEDGNTFQWA